jgi:hypothetical protein
MVEPDFQEFPLPTKSNCIWKFKHTFCKFKTHSATRKQKFQFLYQNFHEYKHHYHKHHSKKTQIIEKKKEKKNQKGESETLAVDR